MAKVFSSCFCFFNCAPKVWFTSNWICGWCAFLLKSSFLQIFRSYGTLKTTRHKCLRNYNRVAMKYW